LGRQPGRGVYKLPTAARLEKSFGGRQRFHRLRHARHEFADARTITQPCGTFAQAWTFRSGGAGSGIFQIHDAESTWTELNQTTGQSLRISPTVRIALAVAPSKPQWFTAMVEAKEERTFRSDDAGRTGNSWMPACS